MKMNRRNAIVAATLAVGAAGSQNGVLAAKPDRNPGDGAADNMEVATVTAECSAVCAICVDACAAELMSGGSRLTELMEACRDCGDISAVTATLLARKGPMAPAILQACADACSRLVVVCRKFSHVRHASECGDAAARCASACRHSIA